MSYHMTYQLVLVDFLVRGPCLSAIRLLGVRIGMWTLRIQDHMPMPTTNF